MFATSDRRSLRAVFFSAWKKHRAGEPTEGAERLIVQVAQHHPEYQPLLENPDTAEHDYAPEIGPNPFLHMAMHIAIEEGLTIDQPPGIRTLYRELLANHTDEHALQHRMMDCLGEMLRRAQRDSTAPDQNVYLACLRTLNAQR